MNSEFGHRIIGDQCPHLIGPIQVIDLSLNNQTFEFVAIDDLCGIINNATDTQQGPNTHHAQQTKNGSKASPNLLTQAPIAKHRPLLRRYFSVGDPLF